MNLETSKAKARQTYEHSMRQEFLILCTRVNEKKKSHDH